MATYTITVNERTHGGRALMAYLKELGVLVEKQISFPKSFTFPACHGTLCISTTGGRW